MIAYYGRHYSAFFHCRSRDQWLIFDDEKIKVVGKSWDDVIANCCRAHWQPSVLFYELRQDQQPPTVPGAAAAAAANGGLAALSSPALDPPSLSLRSQACMASSSFTSTSVSAALACPTTSSPSSSSSSTTSPSSSSSMRRSLSDYGVGGGSPSRQYTPTAPINIAGGLGLGASMSASQTQQSLRSLMPLSKDSMLMERSLLLGEAEKEMEKEDLISSPVDHAFSLSDDVLPSLVASPSSSPSSALSADVVTSYDDAFPLEDVWHATKMDLQPRAHAHCEEHKEMLALGKGKEGKLASTMSRPAAGQSRLTQVWKEKEEEKDAKDKSHHEKLLSKEFVIGQADMKDKEFCIKRAFEAFGRRWLLVLERSNRLNEAQWGSDKRGYEGYIAVRVQRLDPGADILRLAVSFECRVQSRSFASSVSCVAVAGRAAVGDPYFICPQRQRQFLAGRKELGLSLAMRLL
jgi:hypothetical protein